MSIDLHDRVAVEAHAEQFAATYDDLSLHAALVDLYFPPPESYGDAHAERLHEVWEYVEAQPCTCTQPAVDLEGPCPRCRLLNCEFDQYVGQGR